MSPACFSFVPACRGRRCGWCHVWADSHANSLHFRSPRYPPFSPVCTAQFTLSAVIIPQPHLNRLVISCISLVRMCMRLRARVPRSPHANGQPDNRATGSGRQPPQEERTRSRGRQPWQFNWLGVATAVPKVESDVKVPVAAGCAFSGKRRNNGASFHGFQSDRPKETGCLLSTLGDLDGSPVNLLACLG